MVHAARRVGDSGRVFAEDIDGNALEKLRERCQREGIRNVEIILRTVTDPMLPNNELDLVYIINAYFLFENPVELLRNIAPSLKPRGKLVIAECGDVTPKEDVIEKADKAGYKLIEVISLTYENFNVCTFTRAFSLFFSSAKKLSQQ